jgi:serine protease Do
MKSLPIAAMWVLAAGLFAASPAIALTPAEIAETATPSVVLIRLPNGLGTGFVVSDDGRIVTNVHVIRGASTATVVTSSGDEIADVELMATDEAHDLAVLRVHAKGLKALPLGDSATAKPGEHVVAIGHPLGLGNTVSDGLVSAIRDLSPTRTMLQISAPISPGSSGGPLFNDRGEVIGVATLVITGGQNLNFAVPINLIKPLLLIDRGTSLAAYKSSMERHRHIPEQPLSLLDECPLPELNSVIADIHQAIKVGAPLYNDGNFEACFRIYEATALDMDKKTEHCAGPKRALLDGVKNADKLKAWDDKAWAMRDAFDGVLAVAMKKYDESRPAATVHREVPHHELTLFEGCASEDIARIGEGIETAIESGAPLYNDGNIEACYRIYTGAIRDIGRKVDSCRAVKQALQDGVVRAEKLRGWKDKAWALRDAFDGVLEAIRRNGGEANRPI